MFKKVGLIIVGILIFCSTALSAPAVNLGMYDGVNRWSCSAIILRNGNIRIEAENGKSFEVPYWGYKRVTITHHIIRKQHNALLLSGRGWTYIYFRNGDSYQVKF